METTLAPEAGTGTGAGGAGAGTGTVLGTGGVAKVSVLLAWCLALRRFHTACCSALDMAFHLAVGIKSGSL